MSDRAYMRRLRLRLSEAQNHRCAYCGVVMDLSGPEKAPNRLTADHVVPVSRGGTFSFRNLVAACLWCNSHRGNEDAYTFTPRARP